MYTYLTHREIDLLRNVVLGKIPWREICIGKYYPDVERRFYSQSPVLKTFLQRQPASPASGDSGVSTPWTFPKGRVEGHETPYKCALREFEEESGLSAHVLGVPSVPDMITESYTSFDRFVYETRCWVFCIQTDEPALVQPGVSEIAERRWCTQEEAQTLLSPSKYAMLLQAKSRIDSEILTPLLQKPPYLPNYGEHVPVQPEEPDRSPAEEPHCEG
jgi:8-oxo-dGTP pyrophosphatase MutT (NUDIX family)